MSTTDFHAKYFAYALTRKGGTGVERLQQSLLNAAVDLNPHQVEAALFALRSPISKGVLLADEVGLGKTIEAGLVMCQLWAERKRKILVICPASLRKQWQCELEEKFNLPSIIIDAKSANALQREGLSNPYLKPAILISSYPYAARNSEFLKAIQWDVVVMDEAHKLRNSYRESNRVGQALRWALEGRRKLLLTATPLQNALTELYGIATLLDESYFGDLPSFRSRYVNVGGDIDGLKSRLKEFCWRTLRKDVEAYVKYTKRFPVTESFASTDLENALYEDVSKYLQDETTYAFPQSQRAMLTLLVRKVLASSTVALIGTLEMILKRLKALQSGAKTQTTTLLDEIFADDPDLIEEIEEDNEDGETGVEDKGQACDVTDSSRVIDAEVLAKEIALVDSFIRRARSIGTDKKTQHLLSALHKGWARLKELGAAEKAVIFTESRRTMTFLKEFLEANGYAGQVVCFSGGGKKDATSEAIYQRYREQHPDDKTSKPVMMRHALIDAFRHQSKILIATEAGAEGINLQFCSMVVNYDLPFNPQRVEQRIGRCHRYGQKCDVVVINFLNTRNAADVRVYELLEHKLRLFEGLFGASNGILGVIDKDGKSFEARINAILQSCRTPQEIEKAFDQLQAALQDEISAKMEETRQAILDHLDEDVRKLLKVDPTEAQTLLSESEQRFMRLTRHVLAGYAQFSEEYPRLFILNQAPFPTIPTGTYTLDIANAPVGMFAYRPNSVLGEWVLEQAKLLQTPFAEVSFDITHYNGKVSVLEALKGTGGILRLDGLRLKSLDEEEFLLFSAITDAGKLLEPDVAEKLFSLAAEVSGEAILPKALEERLAANATQYAKATANVVGEANNVHFKEATEKLMRWSEDQVAAVTHKIEVLRARQLEIERAIRQSKTLDEQVPLQKEFDDVRRKIRRARVEVADIEDETDAKRRSLLDALQRKLIPEINHETLFTLRWKVI